MDIDILIIMGRPFFFFFEKGSTLLLLKGSVRVVQDLNGKSLPQSSLICV